MVGNSSAFHCGEPRSSRCSSWCLWACQEHLFFKHHTVNRVYRRLTWSLSLSLAFRGVGGHSFALTEYKAPVLRDAPGRSPYNTHVASTMGHGGLLHDHFVMRSMLQEEMHSVNITHLCQRPYVEHLSCCKGALHGSAVVAIHGGCLWQLQFTGSPVQQFGFVYWQSAEKDLCKCGIDESRVQ